MKFNLEDFEHLAYTRQHEAAAKCLMVLLTDLDSNYGRTGENFSAKPLASVLADESDEHIWTRVASAITALFSDPDFHFSPAGFKQIFNWHRWFASIFAATPYRNADHIVRAMNINGGDLSQVQLEPKNMLKFCLLYTPESEIPLNLDALWAANKVLAAGLSMVLMSPRFLGSPLAHQKREQILPWLTQKLPEIDDITELPAGILHDVYMHCSYADRDDKHEIKRSINILIKRFFEKNDIKPLNFTKKNKGSKHKPKIMVVVEWFYSAHAMYRCYGPGIEKLKDNFEVVGIGYPNVVDETSKNIFSKFVPIESGALLDQIRQIRRLADEMKPDALYMPSVGMFHLTMYLSNLRLAPVQAISIGHPATTFSPNIDFVFVIDGCYSQSCFSEKPIYLAVEELPFAPYPADPSIFSAYKTNDVQDEVHIALCATSMKLNPSFLKACADVILKAKNKVHYQFFIGQAQGLVYPQIKRVAHQFLGENVTVHPHQSYQEYIKSVSKCDMFINPFPFGNTNGIVDTVSCGLIGVNKSGREVHSSIDKALFSRLGMPDWLSAESDEKFVDAVVRLVDSEQLRTELSKEYSGLEKVQTLFKGKPDAVSVNFMRLLSA